MKNLGKATFRWGNPGEYLDRKLEELDENELQAILQDVFRA